MSMQNGQVRERRSYTCRKIPQEIHLQTLSTPKSIVSVYLKKQPLTQKKEKIHIDYIISPRQEKIIVPKVFRKTEAKPELQRSEHCKSQVTTILREESTEVKKLKKIKSFVKNKLSKQVKVSQHQLEFLTPILKLKQKVQPVPKDIKKLINKSLSQHKKQKMNNMQKQQEQTENQQYLKLYIKEKDKQIRLQNKERFLQNSDQIQLPWGFNQIKIIQVAEKPKLQMRSISQKERRERIGADFLNQLQNKSIQKKIIKQKKKILKEITEESLNIRDFKIHQKEDIKQQIEFEKKMLFQEKIIQNQQKLQLQIQKIKQRFKKHINKHQARDSLQLDHQKTQVKFQTITQPEKKTLRGGKLPKKAKKSSSKEIRILDHLATMIQKHWRGYKTRNVIKQYYQSWLDNQQLQLDNISEHTQEHQDSLLSHSRNETEQKQSSQRQQDSSSKKQRVSLKIDVENIEAEHQLSGNHQVEKKFVSNSEMPYARQKIKNRLALGSEKMIKYFQNQQLSSSWSSPNPKKKTSILLNQSDMDKHDSTNKSQNENVFSTDPFYQFAEQVYHKISEEQEKVKFIDFLKRRNTDEEFIKKLQIKPKNHFDKWVEPKQTPTPKNSKQFEIPNVEQKTERSLVLQQKVNTLKNSQASNDDSGLLQQSQDDKKSKIVEGNILESNQKFEQTFECEESLNQKVEFDTKAFFQNKVQGKKTVKSTDIESVTEEILQNIILEQIRFNNQQKYESIDPGFEFIEEVLNQIWDVVTTQDLSYFLKNINLSLNNNIPLKLKQYQKAEFQQVYQDFVQKPNDILSSKVLTNFQSENSIEQIYFQLITDNFRESIEYFRPFDVRGKALPWKINDKKLTFSVIDETNVAIVFEQAKNKVLENSSYFCGFLNDPRPFAPPQIDPMFMDQIRQEKLDKMILNDIYEQNEQWLDYQDEECVVTLEISDLIIEDLIKEFVQELKA